MIGLTCTFKGQDLASVQRIAPLWDSYSFVISVKSLKHEPNGQGIYHTLSWHKFRGEQQPSSRVLTDSSTRIGVGYFAGWPQNKVSADRGRSYNDLLG